MIPLAIIAGVRSQRGPRTWIALLTVSALLALILHIGLGGSSLLSPAQVLGELFHGDDGDAASVIVWRLRLPRALACALVGAILASVGAAFQSLFRNPLAEPYVIGVSSGAAVGGTAAILLGLGAAAGGLATLGLAFVGGMGSLLLVMALARRQGVIHVTTLLVAGVVVGAMLSAVMTLLLLLAGQDTNRVLRWLLGSTTPMFWSRVLVLTVVLAIGLAILIRQARALNAFAVSDFMSERLGVDTVKLKWIVLITGTAMVSAAVGSVGIIGFLGLVAPHVARRIVGIDLRRSMPASAALGAGLLLLADVLAQRIKPGMELPVGAVTAIIGAPTLLALLKRKG